MPAAYEVGVLRGQGKTVFGFTNDARDLRARTLEGGYETRGMHIEAFGQPENLMLAAAVRDQRGGAPAVSKIATPPAEGKGAVDDEDMFTDLRTFTTAVAQAAAWWRAVVASGEALPAVTPPPSRADVA